MVNLGNTKERDISMKTMIKLINNQEVYEVEADWANASSPIMVDGSSTPFQVASFAHRPENLIGWEYANLAEWICSQSGEEYIPDEWAIEEREEEGDCILPDGVATSDPVGWLCDYAKDSELTVREAQCFILGRRGWRVEAVAVYMDGFSNG